MSEHPAVPSPTEPAHPAPGPWRAAWGRLRRNRMAVASAAVLLAMALACVLVPWLSRWRYDVADLATGPTAPSWSHWMGTDEFGRDVMARTFFGGRISFTVALVATLVSLVIGVTWGGVAGYAGRRVDAVMMRIVDALYAFPFLVFVILLGVFFAGRDGTPYALYVRVLGWFVSDAADPRHFPAFQVVFVFVALGAISWLTMARIVRGQVMALRARPFVEAARCIGAGHTAIVFRHLLPNAAGPIIAYATLTIPQVILTETFLSFLGLGTQEPLASWGLLVSGGAETMDVYPWLLAFPGSMLTIALFCFNFLGDGLRDALDPHTERS